MAEGFGYCGPLKTSHKGFCLTTLEKLMKYWPGGSYIVINSTRRVPGGRPILDIGYKYNSRKFLRSIDSEGGGSTKPGDPCLSSFPDIFLTFIFAPLFVLNC